MRKQLMLGLAAVAMMSVSAMAASASAYGKVIAVVYGVDPNRVGIQVRSSGGGCPSTNPKYYTFTNKPVWADAIRAALQDQLTVEIAGTGACSLGVEEVAYLIVKRPTPPPAAP